MSADIMRWLLDGVAKLLSDSPFQISSWSHDEAPRGGLGVGGGSHFNIVLLRDGIRLGITPST